MKKAAAVLVVLAAAAAIYFAVSQNRGPADVPSSASGPSSTLSSSASAVQPSAALPSVPASSKAGVLSSGTETVRSIESQIDLDWNKYRMKESSDPLKLQGKTYRTFEIWYDDYLVGPRILLDPDDGKVYTRSYVDGESVKPVPVSEDKAFDKTMRTVLGTVTEQSAMMSFFIKTEDGSLLAIPRYGIDTSFSGENIVGKKIRVYYTGVIKGDDMCRAFVSKAELVK